MSDVTVIGLGTMGSAIANAFLNASYDVTVWNRSPMKMEPFRKSGAQYSATAAEACAASPVVVICIDDYSATRQLFEEQQLGKLLQGKTLIQFSTGTPREARESEAAAKLHNASYLDGALLAYPREVGQDAIVAISGDENTYRGLKRLLAALSTNVRYLGPSIGAAAALDVAMLSFCVSTHLGLIHSALICESENVPANVLAATIVDSQPGNAGEIIHLGQALLSNKFSDSGASVNVYSRALDRILSQAKDANLDASIPQFANRLYKKGVESGLGDEEVVALIKLLR